MAMVDMKFVFNTSMAYISLVSTFAAIGSVVGSMAGFLYKYIDRQTTLVIMTFNIAIFTTLIPFCPNIWLLYLCTFIAMVGGGAYDSSTSVWIIELWGDQSGPWLQISGLTYGLGNILAPMIVRPYLTGDLSHRTESVNSLVPNINNTNNIDINNSVDRRALLQVPYMIVGAICTIGPVLLLIMHLVKRYHVPMDRLTQQPIESKPCALAEVVETNKPTIPSMVALSLTMRVLIIALIAVSMSLYVGMEFAYFSNSPTYFQYLAISLSAKQSADLLTAVTTTYTLGRISAAYMASKLRPEVMLAIHYVIIGISLGTLYLGQTSIIAIWIGNVGFGLGLSALWSGCILDNSECINKQYTALEHNDIMNGMANNILAPTMVDMKFMFRTSMSLISYVITLGGVGYMIGSLSGFLYRWINRQITLIIMTVIMGVFCALMPICTNLWQLYLCYFTLSLGSGAWDSSNAVWAIEMWADNSPPVLQLSQMMSGLGSILAPLLVRPYLTGDLSDDRLNSTANDLLNLLVNRRSRLTLPYMVTGAMCLTGLNSYWGLET
ncbi:unnamed protein product, partial [Medioppia subpectinata]